MSGLNGKVALVTGGSRGIGAAIARTLAQGGADVALTYVEQGDRAEKVVGEIEATGRRGLAIQADSADATAVTAAVDRAAEQFGRLDILVSNAGIFPYGIVDEVTVEEVDRTLAINIRAVYLASQAAVRHMRDGGRIVTTGSNLAEHVPFPGVALYAMSKAALIGLTKGLARDLGPRDITVNIVQPGSTDTEMNPADAPGADEERRLTALGRYNDPQDVAEAVAYLAGPAGRNVTGASITVDGGTNA